MELEDFKKVIKTLRKKHIDSPMDVVVQAFNNLDLERKELDYFLQTPSRYVGDMRNETWKIFLKMEDIFNKEARKKLWESSETLSEINEVNITTKKQLSKILAAIVDEFDEHLFELNKSNTNSRRARAGKELEYIFQKLIMMLLIRYDDQAMLGKDLFQKAGLSKSVDFVIPGVNEYQIDKHKCALISMKTSLRERWQEVPEELSRTGAHVIYLFTLDDSISQEIIDTLSTHNIKLVILDQYKEATYPNNRKVYGLRTLIRELLQIMDNWKFIHDDDPSIANDDFIDGKLSIYKTRKKASVIPNEKEINKMHIQFFENL